MHPAICTLSEAAEIMSFHPRTMATYIRGGRLPGARYGHSYRCWRPALIALAQGDAYELTETDDPWFSRSFISTQECMEALGLAQGTVLTLIDTKKLPAHRFGRPWRVDWPAVRDQMIDTSG